MAWPTPEYTKNHVRTVGKQIVKCYEEHGHLPWGMLNLNHMEYQILENWRTSHGAVLNTAQAWLRRLDKNQRPIVGQRLKRHETVIDKLITKRSKDLSTMHDIAGIRAIFRTSEELYNFREQMQLSRAQHRVIHGPDKYDYIKCPKASGYRGIHDVMERNVSSRQGLAWNGMKFEVQLRTLVQHAWATAVEIYDATRALRFKFKPDDDPAYRQFLIISEMFARVHEGQHGCLPYLSDKELINEYFELDEVTNLLTMFRSMKVAVGYGALKKNSILRRTKDGKLEVFTYASLPQALNMISHIERGADTLNAVLVGSSTPNNIKAAFSNYFEDTTNFVSLLEKARDTLMGTAV